MRTYTTADGLAQNLIYEIVPDPLGFVWFCTEQGLSRFDGYQFTNYGIDQGLPDKRVWDVLITKAGDRWVATSRGLCRFVPDPSKRTDPSKFFTLEWTGPDDASRDLNVLLEDENSDLWCGTENGLYCGHLKGGHWEFQSVPLVSPSTGQISVGALLLDRRGFLWIGTSAGLFRRSSEGTVEKLTMEDSLSSDYISTLMEDSQGRIWVGKDNELCRLSEYPHPGGILVARRYLAGRDIQGRDISSLIETPKGNMWIGAVGGLTQIIFESKGKSELIIRYTKRNGLIQESIMALAQDKDGDLWIGTEAGGAMKIPLHGFVTYDEQDGLAQQDIHSVFEDRAGELCAESGIHGIVIQKFDGQRFSTVRPRLLESVEWSGLGTDRICLQDHMGEWWVATRKGLCRYARMPVRDMAEHSPLAVYTTRDGLSEDHVIQVYEDSRGDIWVGTYGYNSSCLNRWDRRSGRFHIYSEGIPHEAPTAFCEDRSGSLWIGFYAGGVARYRDGRFLLLSAKDGIPDETIAFHLDHLGRLWIASRYDGVRLIEDPAAARPGRIKRYTTHEGLLSDEVGCITEDAYGRMYFGTGHGLDVLDPEVGGVEHYTSADGLPCGTFYGACRDRSGALWFATATGLARFIPPPSQSYAAPHTFVTGLRINGVAHPLFELGETAISGLVLKPNQNQLEIDSLGIVLGSGRVARYQYKLEGAGEEWGPQTPLRTVNYTNLSSGTYRFSVRAITEDGSVSSQPATISFRILSPIWRRWWFLMLEGAALIAVAYAIYRSRLRRHVEVERVRTRIATDLHDDIGANLSWIAIMSEVVGRRTGEGDQTSAELLSRIANTSRDTVESMSDIVWSINPKEDRVEDLVHRMRRLASDTLATSDIHIRFNVAEGVEELSLDPLLRREVYLIWKEAIANIARHSKCTQVDAALGVAGRWMDIAVTDNGRGFDPQSAGTGHGLQNMRARTEALGGLFTLASRPGEGTHITVRIPLRRSKTR